MDGSLGVVCLRCPAIRHNHVAPTLPSHGERVVDHGPSPGNSHPAYIAGTSKLDNNIVRRRCRTRHSGLDGDDSGGVVLVSGVVLRKCEASRGIFVRGGVGSGYLEIFMLELVSLELEEYARSRGLTKSQDCCPDSAQSPPHFVSSTRSEARWLGNF